MDKLLEILYDIRPEINFMGMNDFLDNDVLDSFDIITLVSDIEEAFSISISGDDILPENFNSLEAMMDLIKRSGGKVEF